MVSENIENEDSGYHTSYKEIGENGNWIIIKFNGDMAYYSWCPNCGYTRCNSKIKTNPIRLVYQANKEFKYCPMCGSDMEILNDVKIEGVEIDYGK